jgi:alpha-1,2-mannosyltransferase
LRQSAQLAGEHSLLVSAAVAMIWLLVVGWHRHALAFDVNYAYLHGAHAVLAGRSPFPPLTASDLGSRTAYVYPPLTAFLYAPLAALPSSAADVVATIFSIGCALLLLRVMNIRDWRCYAIALLWLPTFSAIQNANLTLPIAVGLALLWRWRDRVRVAAVLVGFLVALKLFLWPLFVWLVATRRYRATAGGVAAVAVFVFAPWAVIGFAGLTEYPHLLNMLSHLERAQSYSLAVLVALELPWRFAEPLGLAFGLVILVAAWIAGRRDERLSFALAIAAVLALSPIVWMHYFVFVLVVVALFKPRFGWVWLLPLLLWISPAVWNGAAWQTGLALAVVAATLAFALRADAARRPTGAWGRALAGGTPIPARINSR